MREFGNEKSKITSLSLPSRLLYTAYAAFTAAGLCSIVVLYDQIVDFSAHATPHDLYGRLVKHYVSAPTGDAPGACVPSQTAKLLETTHAHLFTMPVLLLVAGHLFLLTALPKRVKTVVVGVASAMMGLHLLAPWIVYATAGEPISTALYPLSGGGLLISLGLMLAVPVWEMWR